MKATQYRPDIDGLRALAVLLVILYHLEVPGFSGGFIGVDVFFAISGYLITGIVVRELETGRFTFKQFYRRRILRLLPVLLAVVAATSVAASVILFPLDLESYFEEALAVAGAAANIVFWKVHGGYFNEAAHTVPLLHLWSLAVEEQFYLFWPATLVVLHSRFSRSRLLGIVALAAIASLVVSEATSARAMSAAYYLLPARAFELLIGAALALGSARVPRFTPASSTALGLGGIILVLASAMLLNADSQFPGLNALWPCVGAALLIVSGREEQSALTRCLSWTPLVRIGLMSYSLYLWHWPIIAYTRYLGFPLTPVITIGIGFTTVLLSWLSWKYVEVPFRTSADTRLWPAFRRWYLVPGAAALLLFALSRATSGHAWRFSPTVVAQDSASHATPGRERSACHSERREWARRIDDRCRLGSADADARRGLLVGDSHANHFTPFIDVLAGSAGIFVTDYTLGGCIPLFGLEWGRTAYTASTCRARNNIVEEYIRNNAYDVVVLAGSWPRPNNYNSIFLADGEPADSATAAHMVVESLRRTIEVIEGSGATAILILDNPRASGRANCPLLQATFRPQLACSSTQEELDRNGAIMRRLVSEVLVLAPGLVVVDPNSVICDGILCTETLRSTPLYFDSGHLTTDGARVLALEYEERYGNPFVRTDLR